VGNNFIFGPRPHVTTLHHHQHHDYTSVRLSNQQQQQQPKRRIAGEKVVTVPFALTEKHTMYIYTVVTAAETKSSTHQVTIQITPN
jgi:hypothetical protein